MTTMPQRLKDLHDKILNDEPVTDEEYKEVIAGLRGDRMTASGKGTKDETLAKLPDDINDLFK